MKEALGFVVIEQLRHYLYDNVDCKTCQNQSLEKNLDDLKASIIGSIHILADTDPSYQVIINIASGRLRQWQ